uniref:CSC1-like protein HYP1 n=1 Tax=Erigeron canadensis TaxID=72917 RepID=UPI001CB9BFF1|nr:CSC1-like protein HYP1 [Erigeron canadensis]XP_043615620.1 CSC1-like protein HYP1 [Erigeron canadensis]
MILSALLTSVGINLGLCFLFFILYSILSKQPGNADVYAPRLVAEGKLEQRNNFNLERLLPSTSWVSRSWNPSEEELLLRAGLDGVVFMRIIIFSLKVAAFAAVVGLCALLPINYMGSQIFIDFSDLTNKSLESFSISNVNDGSKKLWVHFAAIYIFTAFVCYLLYVEYRYISLKRLAYYYSSEPKPEQFTVLVRGIPKSSTDSLSGSVAKFFSEYYPSLYLSHCMVYHTTKIQKIISDAGKVSRKLAHLKSTQKASQRFGRVGFCGIFGPKVDLLDYYEKKLEDLEEKARKQQSLLSGKEVPAAFVSFKSRLGAAVALHIQQGENPTEWLTERAPEPRDIYWPFFSASFLSRWIGNVVVVFACVILTILFFIPVIIVQGLTNLDQLETWFPFLKDVLNITFISQVITGYLPSLILKMFLYLVPPVMIMLSSIQGYVAHSQIARSACNKMLWFTIWNIFFANALSGSVLYRVNIFLEPKEIPTILAVAVPGQATFFITYVVTNGWTNTSSELFRLMPLVSSYMGRIFSAETGENFEVPSLPYSSEIPSILLFGLLGITYFFLSPLILPFLLVYYCLAYIIYRHQLLNVYSPKFETGGTFWPIVHNATVFSLVLMHIIAVGIFGLKQVPLASALTTPLPIITLLFNSYCRKRFLPVFKGYPAESMIKKDRIDENNPAVSDLHEKLISAYQDPALKPTRFSGRTDGHNAPLLASEV